MPPAARTGRQTLNKARWHVPLEDVRHDALRARAGDARYDQRCSL